MEYTAINSSSVTSCGTLGLNSQGPTDKVSTVAFKGEVCTAVSLGSTAPQSVSIHPKKELLSVERYAARPFILDSFTLSSTTYSKDLGVNEFTNLRERLPGAVGFRCTLRLRLQIVGTPFVSGIYRLAFSPLNTRFRSDAWGANITMATQLPGVNLNLHDATEVQLLIPYTHIYDYLPVALEDWNPANIYGTIWLIPVIPVNVGTGGDGVRANIWMSFEDVQLEGAAAYPRTTGVVLHAGVSATGMEQQCVDEHECKGSALSTAKTAIDVVAPQLSPILGTAAWAARKAAGFADALGYAKANFYKTIKYVRASRFVTNNVDAQDSIPSLVSHAINGVDTLAETSATHDEMAIKAFASRYAVVGTFDLSTSDVPGWYKYISSVTPYAAFWPTLAAAHNYNFIAENYAWVSGADDIVPSPLFYIANCFQYWRGTIKYRFDVGKTKFHAGRIEIAYCPTGDFGGTSLGTMWVAPPYESSPRYGKTVIWDLRESSFCEFECPYEFYSYYTPYNTFNASLSVVVIDPLICPATVQSAVTVRVSMAGGDDIEFAHPIGPQYLPYSSRGTLPSALRLGDDFLDEEYKPSGCVDPPSEVVPDVVLHGPDLFDQDAAMTLQDDKGAQRAIGEEVLSIKQLVSRPSTELFVSNSQTVPSNGIALPSRANVGVFPYSWFALFNHVFAFCRGGTRYQMVGNSQITKLSATFVNRGQSGTKGGGAYTTGLWQADYNNPCQFTIPYLSLTSRTISGDHLTSPATGLWNTLYYNKALLYATTPTLNSATGDRFYLMTSATDDWQYFWQLPCPALIGGANNQFTAANSAVVTAFSSTYAS